MCDDILLWQCSFVSPHPRLLYTRVSPQSLQRFIEGHRERLSVSEVWSVFDHLDVIVELLRELDIHVLHRLEQGLHPAGEVVEYQLTVVFDFTRVKWEPMDKPHLLARVAMVIIVGYLNETGTPAFRIVDFPESPEPNNRT